MSSQHSNQHKYSRNLTNKLFLISSHYYFTPDSLHTPLILLFAVQLFLSFINSNSCLLQPLYHVLLFTIVHPHPQRFLHNFCSMFLTFSFVDVFLEVFTFTWFSATLSTTCFATTPTTNSATSPTATSAVPQSFMFVFNLSRPFNVLFDPQYSIAENDQRFLQSLFAMYNERLQIRLITTYTAHWRNEELFLDLDLAFETIYSFNCDSHYFHYWLRSSINCHKLTTFSYSYNTIIVHPPSGYRLVGGWTLVFG